MPNRLLDRQASLLSYLTSGNAIFGAAGDVSPVRPPPGMDGGLLRLEAEFSHDKRMAKIAALLPRTLGLLTSGRAGVISAFVQAVPPITLASLDNARQFQTFLSQRWNEGQGQPPYLPDLAACELARADVRASRTAKTDGGAAPRGAVRRARGAVLLRCAYDVRTIFEAGSEAPPPQKRETLLAVVLPPGTDQPVMAELPPDIFALVSRLDDYTDPATVTARRESAALADLVRHGIIEVAA